LKVKLLERKGDTLHFLLHGVPHSFVNALRRIILSEVPTMAIDDVFFFEKTPELTDEEIAHRLGLIPLTTDLDSYVLPEKCECRSELGCDKCRVAFTLEVRAESESRTVYSADLIPENSRTRPVSDRIPIAELAPGQVLKFEAYARLGTGQTHAKWQPVSEATYQNTAEIRVDSETCTLCGKCVTACPRKVFTKSESGILVERPLECILCRACEEECPVEPSAVKAAPIDDAFMFKIESTGSLSPERVVTEAARILGGKMEDFKQAYELAAIVFEEKT